MIYEWPKCTAKCSTFRKKIVISISVLDVLKDIKIFKFPLGKHWLSYNHWHCINSEVFLTYEQCRAKIYPRFKGYSI